MIIESYEDLIKLSGSLRSNFWETIHTAISLALKRSAQGVIIDCSGITDCNSEGAETFRDIQIFLERHDARVIVAEVPDEVMAVLKTVKDVRSQLPIAETVEIARASLNRLVEPEEEKEKRKKPTPQPGKRYLVCILDSPSDSYALQVACEHAESNHAGLVLVHPVVVPRELPIQAPLMAEETLGESLLEKGHAYCDQHEVPCSLMMPRGRDFATAIDDAVQESRATQVFVPLGAERTGLDDPSKLVKQVMARLNVPVLFVHDRS